MNQKAPNKTAAKSRIKINRRGLTELVLASAFLSLFTFALWSWQNNGGYVAAMESVAPEASAAMMPQILRHPAIMFSTVVSEFVLLLAIMLAIVPVSWWMRSDHLIAGDGALVMTPLRWLGQKLGIGRAATAHTAAQGENELPGEYVVNEAGETVFVPQQGVDGEVETEVVMVEQPDGSLLAMVQQADGTLAPAEPLAKDATAEESTELPLPFPGQPDDALNFEEEEEDPLADLADIGDILSSAFDDDSAIDPEREAIGRTLDEVEITALLKNARNVLATFQQ
jgi:hypothetical protein